MELLVFLVAERIWTRVNSYLDDHHKKKDEKDLDKRLDRMTEKLSKIEGKMEVKK